MAWQVAVTGSEHVLAELARAFRSDADFRLERVGDSWVLTGSRVDALPDAEGVHAEGARVVTTLSGIARLCLGASAALSDGAVWEVKPDGSRAAYVFATTATAFALASSVVLKWTRADGTIDERRPSDPAPAWLRAALANPDLVDALIRRDAEGQSWWVLYNIYDVIQKGTSGKKIEGWPSEKQIDRFKRTACSPAVVGVDARHGVQRGDPPADPMSLPEARLLIDSLLVLWLENP